MPKFPEKKVKDFIESHISQIEENASKLIDDRELYFLVDDDLRYEKIGGEIKLLSLEFTPPKTNHSLHTKSSLYDVKFSLSHEKKIYTFETSNYYYNVSQNELFVEDVLDNIGTLLNNFRFLLEWEDYLFNNSDDEDDDSYTGFYIDDDDNWVEIDEEYTDLDLFRDCVTKKGEYYIYDYIEETGKFYWRIKENN
jgi:hypothetical protein